MRMFLAAMLGCGLTLVCSCIGQSQGTGETPREKLDKLRAGYQQKKAEGYDVSAVEQLIPQLREAIQSKDVARARQLALQADQLMSRMTGAPGAAAPVSTATSTPMADLPMPPPGEPRVRSANDIQPFSVGWAHPGLAKPLGKLGVNCAKVFSVPWYVIEPDPPQNGVHHYDWKRVDDVVQQYQSVGVNLQLTLNCESHWATKPIQAGKAATITKANAPKDDQWQNYADFVYNLVKRYDGSGNENMPGLKMPIRYFEIETEAQYGLLWRGTPAEYIRLLKTAYASAKKANPSSLIILSGLNFGDFFDDYPSEAVFSQRVGKNQFVSKAFDFVKETLAVPEAFDLVEFHANRNYTGIYGSADWIRAQMKKNGYEKPIWAGDATSAPWIIPTALDVNPILPAAEAQQKHQALNDPHNPAHDDTVRWFLAEQAKLTAKKCVVACDAGLQRIIIETISDPSMKEAGQSNLAGFSLQGIVNSDLSPKPAFRTLKMMIDKLGDYTAIQRLPSNDAYIYRLEVKGVPVYVAWTEKSTRAISVPAGANHVVLSELITSADQTAPAIKELVPENGKVTVTLTSTPILLELRR